MAAGEGAAVVALVRADRAPRVAPVLVVAGFGASTDAVHVTAPDRTGRGVVAASRAALVDAGIDADAIGLVSAHGTATPFNDAAESIAVRHVLGERAADVPVHAMKAETGHLFGAAAVVESLSAWRAISTGVAPATAGDGELDPGAPARIVDRAIPNDAPAALKLSLAFGGCNAALVLRRDPAASPVKRLRDAELTDAHGGGLLRPLPELAARLGIPVDRLVRSDAIVHLVLDALADLAARVGRERLASAGLVVGHDVANLATNALFQARIADRGARFAEPRRFPWTSPNACAGEAAIVFGLHAPTFAVGGSPRTRAQAAEVALEFVRAGHADAMIAVEVSERSPAGDALFAAYGVRPPERSFASARLIVAK